MPKHIRNRDNRHYAREQTVMDKVNDYFVSFKKQYIRTPKQTMGWIMAILMIIILGVVAAHYMGYITLPGPLSGIPRKAAPPSHLQYFFF
jgi:hypothetical protein